jgi:two-component system sensor histidine kinase YesM
MSDHIKTVKSRMILLLALFALFITVLALVFSFNIIYTFQRRIVVQSAEFNLRLVASLIEQDLRDLSALGWWCGHNAPVAGYLLAGDDLTARSMEAWWALQERYLNNRSARYVRRLIVFDHGQERFLQVGNSATSSDPVTVYNLWKILAAGVRPSGQWQAAVTDPYAFPADSLVIPFGCPVYDPAEGREIGAVFLAATTGLVTDKLGGYQLPRDSRLYLGLENRQYVIEGDRIVREDVSLSEFDSPGDGAVSADMAIIEGRDAAGKRRTLVQCAVREGITLTQVLNPAHYIPLSGAWPALAAGLGVLCILLVIMAYGVNRMAREIAALMDKQIADEKSKRDLEYRMLQSQINPHFLSNTLNSIKWMATIQNASGIAEMTTALARFLKTLSKDIRGVVPLRDELALLEEYLVIQRYRYGDSVSFERRVGGDLLDTPIPRFTLQPLVENAIFHGIEPRGSGTIILRAERYGGDTLVSVVDDGVGMSAETIAGIGGGEAQTGASVFSGMFRELGIRNVDERIRHAFGEGYGLSIESEEGKYTTVSIRLPGSGGGA